MTEPTEPSDVPARVVGRIRGSGPGSLLLIVGGLHGNEPEGIAAMRTVAAELSKRASVIRGDVVMLAGNLRALDRGQRFLERDLNRCWSPERVAALGDVRAGAASGPEDLEQSDLASALAEALDLARGRIHVVDLHSTSADGVPFVMCPDRAEDRALARLVPLPLVLGLLETVEQTLATYLANRGCVVLAVEGGPRGRSSSIANLEAVLWHVLAATGIVGDGDLETHRARLERARGDLPAVIRVHHRQAADRNGGFCLEPDFANIQRVKAGQLLARYAGGEFRAPADGYMLLPNYQEQGDDGFFLGAEIGHP